MTAPRPIVPRLALAALAALLLAPAAAGCGDGGGGGGAADAPAEVEDDAADDASDDTPAPLPDDRSVYEATLTLDNGVAYTLDRDLTERPERFSFGSTHLGTAVAFSLQDEVTFPASITFTLNFGIIVGSPQFPVQTAGTGTWAFGEDPPELDVLVSNRRYRSDEAGSTGSLVLTSWGTQQGEVFAGTFSGRLREVGGAATAGHLDVSGRFHLILPAKAGGQ